MQKVSVYRIAKRFGDLPNLFIDGPSGDFDPYHPSVYPGLEVEVVEQLSMSEMQTRARDGQLEGVLYSKSESSPVFTILRLTGKTSADVMEMI